MYAKFTLLAELPIEVPPVLLVYQLMVFPDEVARRLILAPGQIEVAEVGVFTVGALGKVPIVIDAEDETLQPAALVIIQRTDFPSIKFV